MDNDDPLLRELLDLDEAQDENDAVDSALPLSAAQPSAPRAPVLAAQQNLAGVSQEPAQPQIPHPAAQPAAGPQQQQQATQQLQGAAGRGKLLGSGTLTVVVSILLRLLQDDPVKLNQVKTLVRNVSQRSDIADLKTASAALMHRLSEIVGPEKIKQAVALQQKMRSQHQQQYPTPGETQQPAQQTQPPQPSPQQIVQPSPAQHQPPQQPLQPGPSSRGVSPAPPTQPQMQQPQHMRPGLPAQQPQMAGQALQQRQAPIAQQPISSLPGTPGAFSMPVQQQQQQQPGMPGHSAGAAVVRTPSPGMYPGAPSPGPPQTQPGQAQGAALHPGLSLSHAATAAAAAQQQVKLKSTPQQKRAADGGADDARDAKKPKGLPAREKKEKDKEGDMHDILDADAFIDMEQETDQLMAGLAQQRQLGTARLAKTQLLCEWRVANEMLKQMTKAGLKRVRPECFEILQLAFQAQATRVLSKAHNMARHRQDTARKLPEMVTVSDPRRGVLQIERREKAKHDARLAAEREELLKAAQSKKADDETKEKAQKAKAELQGKQQASAANAAVAATLGGKGAKWNKWDKWGAGGGGGGGGGTAASGGKKKASKAGATKESEDKGTAAEGVGAAAAAGQAETGVAAGAGGEAGPSVRFADPAGGAACGSGDGTAAGRTERGGSSLPSSRSRAGLAGLGGAGGSDEGGDTIHLRDVIAVMERDPMYCKSTLLYSLVNKV